MINANKYFDVRFAANAAIAIIVGFGSLWIATALILICLVVYNLLFIGQFKINGQTVTPSQGWGFAAVIGFMLVIGIVAFGITIKLLLVAKKKAQKPDS